jgi:hypothetical protein
MPGEFYIEDNKLKNDITEIKNSVSQVTNNIRTLITKSEGMTPVSSSMAADWGSDEQEVVTIGAHDFKCKVQSLLISIRNLLGTSVTVRMYTVVNGEEDKVYEQSFDPSSDSPGLWIINGTVGIHEALRVTLQSDNQADNGQAVDYDYMLEAM